VIVEDAAKSARLSVRRPNAQSWAYATLSSALVQPGQLEDVGFSRQEFLKRNPYFSIY
jgi:hypothetical protein